jgi:hypothetical protein
MTKVFVVWDLLFENVLCVHKTEVDCINTGCEKRKQAYKKAERNRSYYPVGEWFDVLD